MLLRGEYGEFFPPEYSPFPYNFSIVNSYPGYGDFDAARRLGYWFEETRDLPMARGDRGMPSQELPVSIKNVDDSILNTAIEDADHKKKFRIIKYELEFYRKHNLPLPRTAPVVRMAQWRKDLDLRLRFYDRVCGKCGKEIKSMYAPGSPEKNVWCEECYKSMIG